MNLEADSSPKPVVGILLLDTTFPRIRGDIGNPETFPFPVTYRIVAGATPRQVVLHPDEGLIQRFIEAARELIASGVKVIATSCGFLSLFHRQLVEALPVPVFTSSLLQVHMARTILQSHRRIGILTAHSRALTEAHLNAIGIHDCPLAIVGMEDAPEFSAVFLEGKTTLDVDRCGLEVVSAAKRLLAAYPDVGAVVLECTNMPPYADAIRQTTGLPVFDAVTLVRYAYSLFFSFVDPFFNLRED